MDNPTNKPLAHWPQSASALLAEVRQACASTGELMRLIVKGNLPVDSWLISSRILPFLQEQGIRQLHFHLASPGHEAARTAAIMPLPDGSAFASNPAGDWFALEPDAALLEIQYIGFRYAPDDHWLKGFEAAVLEPGASPAPASPQQVAAVWEKSTGKRPQGFDFGMVDQLQALGLDLLNKAFDTRRRLGL